MSVDEGVSLVEKAKEAGAVPLPEAKGTTPGPLLEKLLSSMSEKGLDGIEESRMQKSVHLIKNVQPLPRKIVEAIQEGIFVDFTWFPVLEEGPTERDWKEGSGEKGNSLGSPRERKRRKRKEVPDLSKWSTCFSWKKVPPKGTGRRDRGKRATVWVAPGKEREGSGKRCPTSVSGAPASRCFKWLGHRTSPTCGCL